MPNIVCTVTNDLSQDQRMIRICTTLQRAGYDVTLVGRRRPDSLPLAARSFVQHRLPCRWSRGKLFYLEYNARLLIYLLRRRADIVNAVDLDTLLPAFLATRRRGATCVYDAHEYFTEVPEVVRRPPVRRVWSALAAWIIPRLRHAYTVGPELAKIMGERYGIDFAVVRNLPTRRENTPTRPEATPEKIILYQGMLNEGRGLETAIRAVKLLRERTSHPVVLWLAGRGDVEAELHRLRDENGLGGAVRFLGFVPPDELPALTARAWLGLNLLADTGLSYYYSLANKTFDYIQAGLPALHSDFPEYRALQDRYGGFVLIDRLDPERVAAAIQALLDEPDRYARLVENNRAAAEELVWEREEEKLLAVYRRGRPTCRPVTYAPTRDARR